MIRKFEGELAPKLRIAVHEGFRLGVILRRSSFDEVGRKGERRTGKPDEGNIKFINQSFDGVDDEGCIHCGVEFTNAVKVSSIPKRLGDNRTDSGGDVDTEARSPE